MEKVNEFKHGDQSVKIYRRDDDDYAYSTTNGTWGCAFASQVEAEAVARKVLDDQATRWLEKALKGE